jgi:transcriptional regulator with XRE-family HTH domain
MPSTKAVVSPAHLALGQTLRAARKRAGYKNQEAFAQCIGMDRSYYNAIENGRFNITLGTLLKIADGLESSVAALCSEAKI